MIVEFSETFPYELSENVLCVLDGDFSQFGNKFYLLLKEEDIHKRVFELRFEYKVSPFKQSEIFKNCLLVGFENLFYLVNLENNKVLIKVECNSYFSSFIVIDNQIFVCDAMGIWSVSSKGELYWHNNDLGIDGVIIQEIKKDIIRGSGEWDPPGDWKEFVLDRNSGEFVALDFE